MASEKKERGKASYDVDKEYEQLCVCPFSDEMENAKLSANFNAPKCSYYQGTKDPITHMQHFMKAMDPVSLMQGIRDSIICKLFTTTHCDGT